MITHSFLDRLLVEGASIKDIFTTDHLTIS